MTKAAGRRGEGSVGRQFWRHAFRISTAYGDGDAMKDAHLASGKDRSIFDGVALTAKAGVDLSHHRVEQRALVRDGLVLCHDASMLPAQTPRPLQRDYSTPKVEEVSQPIPSILRRLKKASRSGAFERLFRSTV